MNRQSQLKVMSESINQLTKEAGILDMINLSSIESTAKDFAKEHITGNSPTEMFENLIDLIATGALFTYFPVITTIAELLGVNLPKVALGLVHSVYDMFKSKGSLSEKDVMDNAKNLGEQLSGGSLLASASVNPLYKTAGSKMSWLFSGLLGFILKSLLKGIGVIGVATAVRSLVGLEGHKPAETQSATQPAVETKSEPAQLETHKDSQLLSTQFQDPNVNTHYENTPEEMWAMPIYNNDIEDTLLYWTYKTYHSLYGYKDVIEFTPQFREMVTKLEKGYDPTVSQNLIVMPEGFHTVRSVVDTFATEAAKRVENIEALSK